MSRRVSCNSGVSEKSVRHIFVIFKKRQMCFKWPESVQNSVRKSVQQFGGVGKSVQNIFRDVFLQKVSNMKNVFQIVF